MKRYVLIAAAAIVASGAMARAESFDQTVANKGDSPATLYFGSGNLADNFATSTTTDQGNPADPNSSSTVTIGLRAQIAGAVNFFDAAGPGGIYTVPAGDRPGFTNRATWDYTFSVDLGEGGPSTTNSFANYKALLTIKNNTTGAPAASYDPLQLPDNDLTTSGTPAYEGPADHLVEQNAESPSFNIGGLVDPDVFAPDDYTITLDLFHLGDDEATATPVLSDSINVDVVAPLPASAWSGLALMGGMLAFGATKRLRRQMA